MCLAVPGRILKIEGTTAEVEFGGARMSVSLLGLPEAAAGDYVLVHAGFAIQRLDEQEAKRTLSLLAEAFSEP